MKDKITIYYFPKNTSKLRHAMEAVGINVPSRYYMGMITVLVVKNSSVIFVGNTEVNHTEQVQMYATDPTVELERKILKSDEEFYGVLDELKSKHD